MAVRIFLVLSIGLLSVISVAGQSPTPTPDKRLFLMPVEDVFTIAGRGVVVTGKIERGVLKVGDSVEIVGGGTTKPVTVSAIEVVRKVLNEAKAGDNVGLVLRGVEKADVSRGQVLAKPGTIKAYTKVGVTIELFRAADGGRSTPITTGFRPMIYARTQSLSGTITLPEGRTSIAPGEKSVDVEVALSESTPLEMGQVIAIREGGRTIGRAVVTSLLK